MKAESTELDLGIMPEKKDTECKPCCPGDSDMDKPRYPELCFRGAHADLFRKKYGNCAPGDEYDAEFKLRVKVSADGENEYDKRIEFSVLSIVGDVVEEEPSGDEEKPTKPAARKLAKKNDKAMAEAY
jgi:hypothetical protein